MKTLEEFYPLHYFQELLESSKARVLIDQFINDFVEHSGHEIQHIDKEKGIVTYFDFYLDENGNQSEWSKMDYTFYVDFSSKINSEVKKSKKLIYNKFIELASHDKPHNQLSILLKNTLKNLEPKADIHYVDYPFVKEALGNLFSYIETFDSKHSTKSNLSYFWKSSDEAKTFSTLSELHRSLKEHNIIDSSIDEFINAFTNKEVKAGIKWLDIAKNGQTNKHSLIHFIIELQEENFILENSEIDFNKKIEYVFRDKDGKYLKHIRQSKSTYPRGSFVHEKIDKIINQLL